VDAPDDVEPAAVEVGVGPHPGPWPDDERLDPELLRDGDRRNVVDRYRYWRVVRTANAFNASSVRVVGRKRWNRRGAMVTDRYLHVEHHDDAASLAAWAAAEGITLIGVDNLPGSVPLETYDLPRECVLLFGQEGTGLSDGARAVCAATVSVAQYGSTRSINVGAAAAIALHAWVRRNVFDQRPSAD
jgi:tRNA(Leu) C34 or U34 (ribose-2'-O)-methylase TrmL